MSNSDVYIQMTDVYIWADKNHLGCSYCPCKQSAFTLSLARLQIPCSFVEDNARNRLRMISEDLQATTGSKGTRGSWRLQSMVVFIHMLCVLDALRVLLVSSGNTTSIASCPTPSSPLVDRQHQWTAIAVYVAGERQSHRSVWVSFSSGSSALCVTSSHSSVHVILLKQPVTQRETLCLLLTQ